MLAKHLIFWGMTSLGIFRRPVSAMIFPILPLRYPFQAPVNLNRWDQSRQKSSNGEIKTLHKRTFVDDILIDRQIQILFAGATYLICMTSEMRIWGIFKWTLFRQETSSSISEPFLSCCE